MVIPFAGIEIPVPDDAEVEKATRLAITEYVLNESSSGLQTSDEKLGYLLRRLRRQAKNLGF